jgi:hypothetical protein
MISYILRCQSRFKAIDPRRLTMRLFASLSILIGVRATRIGQCIWHLQACIFSLASFAF